MTDTVAPTFDFEPRRKRIADHVRILQRECYHIAKAKGWWPHEATIQELIAEAREDANIAYSKNGDVDYNEEELAMVLTAARASAGANDGEKIALMHSELSEALEGLRHGNPTSDKLGEPFSQAEEELADCIIRIFDLAEHRSWDIAGAILAKIEVNRGRPYRHGGKKL